MLKPSKKFGPAAGRRQTLRLQTDLRGNILAVSPALLVLTGRRKQELIQSPLKKLLVAKDARKLPSIIGQTNATNKLVVPLAIKGPAGQHNLTFTISRKKGTGKNSRSVLYWNAHPVAAPAVTATPGIPVKEPTATDLQNNEELFRQFADTIPGMIWVSDEQDNTIFFNKSWLHFTGITVQDVAGDGWTKLIHPDDIPVAIELYRNYFRNRTPVTLEYRILTKNKGYRWVVDHSVPRYLPGGKFMGYIGSVMDIHDRKIAEESQGISEERYRSLVHALGEGIVMYDKAGTIIACNDSAEQMLGMPGQQLIGQTVGQPPLICIHEDGSICPPGQYPVSRTLQTGQTLQQVILGLRKQQGMVTWISVNTEPIFYSEPLQHKSPDAVVATIVDITDRKNHEQLLALEKRVLEMNALPSISLKTIADYFLEGLENFFPGMLCSVLVLNDDRISIDNLSAPSLPSEYSNAIKGVKIGPRAGSCGTAMYRKERVITTDIDLDPLWDDYRPLAKQFNLRSCWSLPILNARHEVLATIATYYQQPKMPVAQELNILERVGDLLRIIIENKNAEARIRMNHERYLLVTKATNDAIWDWDVSSNLYWGEGYYTLFGYKPGYSKDGYERWEICLHPDDRERVLSGLNKYLENNNSQLWEDEYRFKKANGEYALVHDRGFLIFDHEGKINRMVGSVQDITEKREMEKMLLEQELNKQKLVAQAVVNAQEKERAEIGKELHDNVNQILTTAKLYLELARNEDVDKADLIRRSAESISDAINEVRTISRSLVPASVGDLGLIDSIQDLVESIKATRKLQVVFDHRGDIDLLMDEKRKLMLFRIIQEQVNNVLKHAGASRLVIELLASGPSIDLAISDNGSGFDPATVRSKKGTGLSNIISRAELFNGKVTLITSPGNGCKLNINVPISNL